MTQAIWGSYKGNKQHLFPGKRRCGALCGRAYCGDAGLKVGGTREKCKFCEKLERGNETALSSYI